MNETLLISLLKLFSFISAAHSEVMADHARSFIEKLLRKELHLQNFGHYINLFQDY